MPNEALPAGRQQPRPELSCAMMFWISVLAQPKKATPRHTAGMMKSLPRTVCGEKSPYPTVEMVMKVK